jgi:shikimate kinase
MAVGKTSVGQLLAARLRLPFLDTDQQIEAAFGRPVADIFETFGESEFRTAERGLINTLLGGERRVMSLGGGAFADEELRRKINSKSTSVWLDSPFELILDRLARSSCRPLAAGRSPDELKRLWLERQRHYAEAHVRIDPSGKSAGDTVEQIIQALN